MIRLASKQASESKFSRARVGAVIAKGNRVLAVGHNRIGHSKYLRNRRFSESIHAEQDAILQLLKARRGDELVGATIYVSRINNSEKPMLSRPCAMCHSLIQAVGIRQVVFTTNEGIAEYEC